MIYCSNKLLNINNGAFLLCCAIGVYINVNNRAGALNVNDWQKFIDTLGSKQINVSVSAGKLVDVINFK